MEVNIKIVIGRDWPQFSFKFAIKIHSIQRHLIFQCNALYFGRFHCTSKKGLSMYCSENDACQRSARQANYEYGHMVSTQP